MIKRLGVKAQKFSSHILHVKSSGVKDNPEELEGQLVYRVIREDCLDGQSKFNNDEFVISDLIDEDIDLDDKKEEEENLLKSALYYGLLTLYLPIHMVPERSQVPLTLAQLQSEVLKLFEPKLTSEDLTHTWNELFEKRSNNGCFDLVVDFLLMRKYILETEYQLSYTPSDFTSIEKYQSWRRNKIKEIDLVLDSIKSARKTEFSCKLEFEIGEVNLTHSPSLQKKTECDFLYHLDTTDPESSIKINNDTKTKNVFESKAVETKKKGDGFKPIFKETIKLSLLKKEQDLKFAIVLSKYAGLKKKEIGHTIIPTSGLIEKLFPKANWANSVDPILIDFPIVLDNLNVGNLQLKINKGNYQHFPANQNNWINYVDKRTEYIKSNLKNIVIPDIYKIKKVLLRRSFMIPKNELNLVTKSHKWILGELDLLFGLSTHNAEISLLDVLSCNIRLLISFSDQFSKSYQTATKMVNDNIKQTGKVNEIMDRTEKKIVELLMHFKEKFPRNKPDGALENVVKLYDTIICSHKKYSFEKYLSILKDLIQKSLENDYELVKKQQLEVFKTDELSAKVLIAMIPALTYKIDRLYDYSNTFPDDIKYECMNWTYYKLFKKDFEKISSNGGFSGHQMLQFCSKLKDLTELVENSNDLSPQKSQLIDTVEASKGYEEQFISELYNKLSNCADRSITIDNWIPVNEDVKHSTSVVDFYTAADHIWNSVSDLEFLNEHLLYMFTEMLAKVTLEYANKVKNSAVQIMTRNTREKSGTITEKPRSKPIHLFTKKEKTSEADDDFVYSEIELTTNFLVMVNDISASKQHLEDIFSNIIEKHRDLKDSEDITKQLERNKEKEEDLDLENEEDLKKSSESYNIGDHQMSALERSRTSIDLIIESLIAIMSSSFRIPIRATLQSAVSKTKFLVEKSTSRRPLSKEDTLRIIQTEIDSILSTELLDSVLTPAFTILSENCYEQLFKMLLENILDIMNSEMINTFIIPTENYDVELDKDKFLSIEQLYALELIHTTMGVCLCGNDENPDTGLSEEIVEARSRLLVKLISLFQYTTPNLISIYQKYVKYPNLNFSNILKKHHILLLMKAKGDKESTAFYKLHQKEAEKQRLIHVFNLKPVEGEGDDDESNDKYEELLLSVSGIYELSPYDIHVTELRILLESKCSRKTKEFLLRDIVDAKLSKHLLSTKGVQFSIKGDEKRVYSISFLDSELRIKFLNVFSLQLKNVGNEQAQLQELKSPQTSNSSSKNLDSAIFEQASDALKSKFKIKNPSCKLVKRMIAQAAYKVDNSKIYISGEVLLFNYGICFHCGSDGVKGTFSLKLNFSIVRNIEGKKREDNSMRIKITLQGGYSLSLYNIDFYENCLSDIVNTYEQWRKDSTGEVPKKTEEKNYFLSKFYLKHIGENDECLDRKLTCGSALTEFGCLFIGNYHICYESDSLLPNNGEKQNVEQIILPVAFIEKIGKYVMSKLLAFHLLSGHIVCFMFQDEKSLEAAYQRVSVKLQSLSKPKISIFGSSDTESNMYYISSILKNQPIDMDSCDQRMLNNAIITKQIQEAPLQQLTIGSLGSGAKDASQNNNRVFHYFSNIGKNIFGSKNKQ